MFPILCGKNLMFIVSHFQRSNDIQGNTEIAKQSNVSIFNLEDGPMLTIITLSNVSEIKLAVLMHTCNPSI